MAVERIISRGYGFAIIWLLVVQCQFNAVVAVGRGNVQVWLPGNLGSLAYAAIKTTQLYAKIVEKKIGDDMIRLKEVLSNS